MKILWKKLIFLIRQKIVIDYIQSQKNQFEIT